jgi:hypothetical protein
VLETGMWKLGNINCSCYQLVLNELGMILLANILASRAANFVFVPEFFPG